MLIIRSSKAMAALSERWRREGRSIGFVPTMGALHEAHASLIRRARRQNGRVVVSVFVNPIQFDPREDFARYPRPFRRDAALCRRERVDALYRPRPSAMYPSGFDSSVEVGELSRPLCGAFRPGHFRGVATVVLKLLLQTRPHRLYLGEKDFQQLAVLRRMARDLDLPVRVEGCPTVREKDGLALSSRNAYLAPSERSWAPRLHRALRLGALAARGPGASRGRVLAAARAQVRRIPGVRVDYLELADERTLKPARVLRGRLRLFGAIRIGRTRLIDNMPIFCEDAKSSSRESP